jgi:hypothetical protein
MARDTNVHGIDAVWYERIAANSIARYRECPYIVGIIDIDVCDRAIIFGRINETEVITAWVNISQQCRSETKEKCYMPGA